MSGWFTGLPRRAKQLIAVAVDFAVFAGAIWGSVALRLDTVFPESIADKLLRIMLVAGAVGVACAWGCGLYREITRYIGLRFAVRVAAAVTLATLLVGFEWFMADRGEGLPRTALINFWLITLIGVGGARAVARTLLRFAMPTKASRVVIYGAGDVGAGLVALLAQDQRSTVVAFVDDNRSRVGSMIRSVPVHSSENLDQVVRSLRADTLLLALPEHARRRRREVFNQISAMGVRVMLVPTLTEIADGTARVDSIRPVKIEDLLGRAPVEPRTELLSRNTSSANVLITGAGGSIGSELARQVLQQGPRKLVLLDNGEFNLYTIEEELRRTVGPSSGPQIVSVMASVTDEVRMEQVIREHRIDTLYHAAAYKHVPLVEANEVEGVQVNAIGTLRTAQAAIRCGVASFVLVSTDKAVRPTSVMGASKRLAEKVLQALSDSQRTPPGGSSGVRRTTRFTMVRFGNVLGSSGSVVPRFTEQIRRGGPVTVTHAEMTRYFMTIPEASSLVIQAGAMGSGGDVFVLDMGEPVRIVDLARSMIRLTGFTERTAEHPHGDIEIVFTGLRPGEKLFEELLIGKDCQPTDHPGILRANEEFIPWEQLERILARFEAAIDRHDVLEVRELLSATVRGYAPTASLS
ncbi:MAG: polysaccharide biosynthesis protein [Planctomycetota bacterium]